MDSDFCKRVPSDYQRRVYTAYINTAENEKSHSERQYCTFDFFPTSLAAIGAKIEGERLGLGTNLFSDEKTIIEKYGYDKCFEEISRNSDFLRSLTVLDESYLRKLAENVTSEIEKKDGGYNVTCEGFKTNTPEAADKVLVGVIASEQADRFSSEAEKGSFTLPADINLTEMTLANSYGMVYEAYVKTDIENPAFILCMKKNDGNTVFIRKI